MTKEEFLTMFEREMAELQDQVTALDDRISEHESKRQKTEEDVRIIAEATRERGLLRDRWNSLNNMVGLPAYARIKAMTPEELGAYNQEKIAEFQPRIDEIAAREREARELKTVLEARLRESITKSVTAETPEAKREALRDRNYFQSELNRYDEKTGYVFQAIARDRESLQFEIDAIATRTPEEIRRSLAEKTGNPAYYEMILTNGIDVSKGAEMLAQFANDPEKADKMARMVANYGAQRDLMLQSPVRTTLFVSNPYQLPEDLRNLVALHTDKQKNAFIHTVEDRSILEMVVRDYERRFKEAKNALLYEELTPEKISFLVGHEYIGYDNGNKRIPTLEEIRQHESKIQTPFAYEHLKDLTERRDKLAKKIIKTSRVKSELAIYNMQIERFSDEICCEIINWYKNKYTSLLGIKNGLDFSSAESLQESLGAVGRDIAHSEEAISELKENVAKARSQLQAEKLHRQEVLDQLRENIVSYAGEEYKDVRFYTGKEKGNVDFYAPSTYADAMRLIETSAQTVYEKGKVNEVREAVNEVFQPKESANIPVSLTEETPAVTTPIVEEKDEYQMPAMASAPAVNFNAVVMPEPETIPAIKFDTYEEEQMAPVTPVAPAPIEAPAYEPVSTPAPAPTTMPAVQYTDPVDTLYSPAATPVQAQTNELETMVTETVSNEPVKGETYVKRD